LVHNAHITFIYVVYKIFAVFRSGDCLCSPMVHVFSRIVYNTTVLTLIYISVECPFMLDGLALLFLCRYWFH